MTHDPRQPGRNASTEEKTRKAAQERLDALRDLRATFSTAEGQRTLARLRAAASIDAPRMPTNLPRGWTVGDLSIFRDGQRSVILQIFQDLEEAAQV